MHYRSSTVNKQVKHVRDSKKLNESKSYGSSTEVINTAVNSKDNDQVGGMRYKKPVIDSKSVTILPDTPSVKPAIRKNSKEERSKVMNRISNSLLTGGRIKLI